MGGGSFMSEVQCIFLEETELQRHVARAYEGYGEEGQCTTSGIVFHNVEKIIDIVPCVRVVTGENPWDWRYSEPPVYTGPDLLEAMTHCSCGHEFKKPSKIYQGFLLFKRSDNGELCTIHESPEGSMWYADWYIRPGIWTGPDSRILIAKCPGGHDWNIDSRASNCALPQDNEHRCWTREGTPPNITVSKSGKTCAAGGGSIQTSNYHGHLHGGVFRSC